MRRSYSAVWEDPQYAPFKKMVEYRASKMWNMRKIQFTQLGMTYEDLIQGCLVRIAKMIQRKEQGEFDESKAMFTTWVNRALHGALIDGVREYQWVTKVYEKKEARAANENNEDFIHLRFEMMGEIPDYFRTGEAVQERETYAREILKMVDTFLQKRPIDRYVFARYFGSGKSMLEIANELGVCEARISQRIKRAIRGIRAMLSRRGIEEFAEESRIVTSGASLGVIH